jgi:GPH family glycoside/pentoside/hexuronide:cation symporter
VKSDLADLLQNKPWLILLASTITFILFVATRSTVTVHYFKYFVGTQDVVLPFGLMNGRYGFEVLVSVFNTIGQVSSIIGVVMLPFLTSFLGKKKTFTIMGVIAIISTAAFFLISPSQIGWIMVMQVFGSLTGGPLSALMWAMYADTADYGEWKTGRRATGLVFSASTMSQKFGWAIGGGIGGWMLSMFGFTANMIPTPEVMQGLKVLMSLIPAGVGILFVALIFFYPLDEDKVAQIQADLADRRKANPAS